MLMQESVSQALYSYWNSLRGDRVAPKRFEIEPSCISGNLPDTFILERVSPSSLRFRLAGTRICEAFGIDFRGVDLFRLFEDGDARIIAQQIASASEGAVCVFRISAGSTSGLSTEFELLILPLTHTRDTIDRFLGALTPVARPNWLGTVALTQRKLLSHELIWPDGVALPAEQGSNIPVLMPTIREARIVRSNRRQFRVYEGGLSRVDNE
ncbi:MAG: PAS domain-containing protein [Hyphomicrobium denitrificans]|nr:PAS domain-containing protein [Hyphomicrobium denitrificans]